MAKPRPEREAILVFCAECGAKVQGTIEGDYSVHPENFPVPIRYSLIKCSSCHSPILAQQDHDGIEDWETPHLLFPTPKFQLGEAVPPEITRAYEDAAKCLSVGAYTPCAIMCRKVVESISNALLPSKKGRTLVVSLKELKTAGHIDGQLHEWSTQVRMVGNEAVHDASVVVDRADAEDVLMFSEALAEYVFTYKQRFDAFTKRNSARKAARRR